MDYAKIVAYAAVVVRDVEIRTGHHLPTDDVWIGVEQRALLNRLGW
jgi:hypothetical protein